MLNLKKNQYLIYRGVSGLYEKKYEKIIITPYTCKKPKKTK